MRTSMLFSRLPLLSGSMAALALAAIVWPAGAGASGTATRTPAPARPAAARVAVDGAQQFRQRCSTCHAVAAGAASTIGPNLRGVVGRRSATVAGFNYSTAMRGANISWTAANLDRYLAAPARMMPGTRMVVAVPDAAQRAAIIRHLAAQR